MNPNQRVDELEQKLLADRAFQHILKLAPESQRELMTFELAKYIAQEVEAAQKEERSLALIYLHDTNRKGDYLRKLSLLTNNTKGKK